MIAVWLFFHATACTSEPCIKGSPPLMVKEVDAVVDELEERGKRRWQRRFFVITFKKQGTMTKNQTGGVLLRREVRVKMRVS
jgi:hypothetical protein